MTRPHVRREQPSSVAAPLIVLQAINIGWTKLSRGAPRAALRRAVPAALSLPALLDSPLELTLLCHQVKYDERDDFRAPFADTCRLQPFTKTVYEHNVAISRVDETVRVDLNWENGAPVRRFTHQIVALAVGDWGRIRFNYRTPNEDTWRYDEWILNIGLFSTLRPDILEVTHPVKIFSSMATL